MDGVEIRILKSPKGDGNAELFLFKFIIAERA
jgi:hypothetical protein